jgi:hypothetical protein
MISNLPKHWWFTKATETALYLAFLIYYIVFFILINYRIMTSFMSTWPNLESFKNSKPQLRKCLPKSGCRHILLKKYLFIYLTLHILYSPPSTLLLLSPLVPPPQFSLHVNVPIPHGTWPLNSLGFPVSWGFGASCEWTQIRPSSAVCVGGLISAGVCCLFG